MLVNAAGPWADVAAAGIGAGLAGPRLRLVQGAHIVVPRLFTHEKAYIFQNADRRIVFALPYEADFTLVGTTDTDFSGDPAHAVATGEEIDYLVDAANRYFRRRIVPADVIWRFAGVRALADTGAGRASVASRDYRLELDAPAGQGPLLTVLGGKITSYRTLAEHVVAKLAGACPDEPRLRTPSWTGAAALPGGDLDLEELALLRARLAGRPGAPPDAVLKRWLASYGSLAAEVADRWHGAAGPGRHFGAGLHEAEVCWLVETEWARAAEDILWRRSKLGLRFNNGQTANLNAFLAAG